MGFLVSVFFLVYTATDFLRNGAWRRGMALEWQGRSVSEKMERINEWVGWMVGLGSRLNKHMFL